VERKTREKRKREKRVEEISQDERRKLMKELRRGRNVSYGSHESCKSLSEELSDYYGGRYRSHTRPHSQRRKNDRMFQEVSISLPYFHGKNNVEAYLDWEMKVEELFTCHHISEERKVPLATLSFQGYALYWWTSLFKERRIHGDLLVEYWNILRVPLGRGTFPHTMKESL